MLQYQEEQTETREARQTALPPGMYPLDGGVIRTEIPMVAEVDQATQDLGGLGIQGAEEEVEEEEMEATEAVEAVEEADNQLLRELTL
jgi:hypothetical protein